MIKALRKCALVAILGLVFWQGQALAQTTPATHKKATPVGHETETQTLGRISHYLDTLPPMKSRFIQINPDKTLSKGTIYLRKPDGMRVEYDPPVPIVLVANRSLMVEVDKELETAKQVPLSRTPAAFLLQKHTSFTNGKVKVVGFSHKSGDIRVTIAQKQDPSAGRVKLFFSDKPLALVQWIVTDSQGQNITVVLKNPEFNVKLPDSLFVYNKQTFFKNDR